jgi:adenylate kinase
MKVVIFGPPGSGKGTYASRLVSKLGSPHISTGDLVREEIRNKTLFGKKVEKYSSSGKLVPDEIITEILKKRLAKETENHQTYPDVLLLDRCVNCCDTRILKHRSHD